MNYLPLIFTIIVLVSYESNPIKGRGKIIISETKCAKINKTKKIETTSQYKVETIYGGPNETEMQAHLFLLIDSAGALVDSIELTHCYIHDGKKPIYMFYCTEYLIFEDCQKYPSKIKILNLKSLKIIYEQSGFLQNIKKGKSTLNPIDKSDDLLLFFSTKAKTYDTFYVNKLELKTFNCSIIDTIITSGDPLSGVPYITEMDTVENMIRIEYRSKNREGSKLLILKYN
ncbi:hypothetical protein HZA73_08475 [candidate division TA06 bacterium]|nr:hypothetical protein [candidate division TA06 bacterium]